MVKIDYTIKNDSTFGCLFAPDGKHIGEIQNEYQFYDVQIQIIKEKVKGYYLIWKGNMLTFDENGQLDKWPIKLGEWPIGYYDRTQSAFAELYKARMGENAPEVFMQIPEKDWRHSY